MKRTEHSLVDIGGGVVAFERAFELDWSATFDMAEKLVDADAPTMYSETVDPESGDRVLLNKSEYIYTKDSASEMPRRCSVAHQTEDPETRRLLDFLEETRDELLLHYIWRYPLAYKVIWWKVKGHLVSYSTTKGGSYLGVHSDTSADYAYGLPHPTQQLATRNSVSCLMYLNDCVDDESQLDGRNFTGGLHHFNYLGITYKPKRGSVLMFPSNYMAAHEVLPITGGHRYSYLGWYAHGTPNKEVGEFVVDPISDPVLAQKATNLYMPSLREDLVAFADLKDPTKSSHLHRLTERFW